jgi:FkbM family methyltransferase
MEQMLRRVKCVTPNPVVFEIGAHHCESTRQIISFFPSNVRYFAFEPDPRNIAVCIRHPLVTSQKVRFIPLALGDEPSRRAFYMSGGKFRNSKNWDESSSLLRPSGHLFLYPEINFDQQIQVEVSTLDMVCEDEGVDHIDFIWMDVQGAEHLVFSGGRKILPRTQFIYTECSKANQLYMGQMTLSQLLDMLPTFCIDQDYGSNVLLRNTALGLDFSNC